MITITMARLWSVLAAADYGVERAALRQGGLYEHLGHAASVWASYDIRVLHASHDFSEDLFADRASDGEKRTPSL